VVQSQSALKHYHNVTIDFGYKWGYCQTILFLDIWTRTAVLYHMLYWTFSSIVNDFLWRAYLFLTRTKTANGKKKIFTTQCKHRIPSFIYTISLFTSLPIIILASKFWDSNLKAFLCEKIPIYEFYHYYDLIMLILVPFVLMVVRFYFSALRKNKNMKMVYRLRCYHVTFVLFTIPILVLNIVSETSLAEKDKPLFSNGILISITAYHTALIIRPLVYTTGCNCICCGDVCLLNYPRVNRWIIYWSRPQHKNKSNIYSQPIQVTLE